MMRPVVPQLKQLAGRESTSILIMELPMYRSHSSIGIIILVLIVILVNVIMKLGFLKNRKAEKNLFYREPSTVSTTVEKQHDMKSSNGNLEEAENNGIPEDYKILEHGVQKLGSEKVSPDDMIMTTISSTRVPGETSNQTTEWITTSAAKFKVLEIPGFPQPVPKPAQLNFVIKKTKKMGKGMFATRDIKLGALVFAERPLTITPFRLDFDRVNRLSRFAGKQRRAIATEIENIYEILVEGRMKEENREAFKQLHNYRTVEGEGFLHGVIGTNGYEVETFDESDLAITEGYTAVGIHASRLNHRCIPNVAGTFDKTSFSIQCTAVKDIKAGEQLFACYTPTFLSAQDRQKKLALYGIVCECPACANATPESDRLRQEFVQRIQYFGMLSDEWVRHPGNCLSEKLLEPVFELKEAMEKECLDTGSGFVFLLIVLYKVYMKMGLPAKAEEYGAKVDKLLGHPPRVKSERG